MAKVGKGTPLRLPAKTKREALDRYKRFLQRSLGCVCSAVWYTADAPRGGRGELVLTTQDQPIVLEGKDGRVYLTATQNFHLERHHRFIGEWKVRTDRYEYTVSLSATMEPELLAWHWHPGSPFNTPHIHARLPEGLSKLHIPTGRVAFEEVCRFLIRDLVVPTQREDWDEVLGDAERRFKEFQSWK